MRSEYPWDASGRPGPRRRRLYGLAGAVLGLLLAAAPARAQEGGDPSDTEARLQALQEQVVADEARLARAREQEAASVEAYEEVQRQIRMREALISTYRQRLQELTLQQDSLARAMTELEAAVDALKGEYRRRARHGYKYGRLHDLALILSAQSINQMLIRIQYLRRFADERRARVDQIRAVTDALAERRRQLDASHTRAAELLSSTQAEEETLERLRADRQRMVNRLRSERTAIAQDLETKRRAVSELEARIRRLAAEEAAGAGGRRTAAEREAYARLSGSFEQNKGRLPWPAQGVVEEPFGNRVNPLYNTTTFNPGLFLATAASAEVRAIFGGEVILVDVMPEYGTLVTVAHGAYKTVYSNFSLVYVEQGQTVEAGQVLGRAGTDAQPRGRGVFFALFREGEATDPAGWLRTR